jgi:putative ABC transport system permease protein
MALGAGRSQVLRLVLREGLWHAIVGLGVGIPISYLANRTLRGLLFGVAATDLVTAAAVALLTLGIVLLATYLPARRASNVAPLDALAQE